METAVLHDGKSRVARDKTATGIALCLRNETTDGFSRDVLKNLAVQIKGDKARGREGRYGPNDPGQPPMWKLVTGGSESQEDIEHVIERETKRETGYIVDHVLHRHDDLTLKHEKDGKTHHHYVFTLDVDSYFEGSIIETDEVIRKGWLSIPEIIEKIRIGRRARANRRIDPESFSLRHARDFLMPVYIEIHSMTADEIESQKDPHYRTWIRRFKPHITRTLDENYRELEDLGLMAVNYHDNSGETIDIA